MSCIKLLKRANRKGCFFHHTLISESYILEAYYCYHILSYSIHYLKRPQNLLDVYSWSFETAWVLCAEPLPIVKTKNMQH